MNIIWFAGRIKSVLTDRNLPEMPACKCMARAMFQGGLKSPGHFIIKVCRNNARNKIRSLSEYLPFNLLVDQSLKSGH